jgi:type IV pilus assembly protein PilE
MRNAPRSSRGFTLIELMIAVAILAILAAIAFPAYQSQMRKANRAAAQGVMMDAANKQQLYLSSRREYASTLADLGVTTPTDVARWYTITVAADNAATPPTFTVTGTPKDAQVADGVLTLDSIGTRKRDGSESKW